MNLIEAAKTAQQACTDDFEGKVARLFSSELGQTVLSVWVDQYIARINYEPDRNKALHDEGIRNFITAILLAQEGKHLS